MTDSAQLVERLRARAHVHSDLCYGRYEPCGEHHAHDDHCGGRPLYCRRPEEPDLAVVIAMLEERIRLGAELTAMIMARDALVDIANDFILGRFLSTCRSRDEGAARVAELAKVGR